MTLPVIFIDDGGVLSDNSVRGDQWAALLGGFLPPLLGGTPEQWSAANKQLIATQLSGKALMELGEGTNYEGFAERYAQAWLNGMCRLVGLPEHPLEECLRIERQAAEFVTPRVHAALPWSAEAVHSLVGLGFHLHTASGERSWELEGYLAGMGIRGCFQHLYGSDLVGHFKSGPEYYERVFADARIAARDAVVVDDTPKAIGWAKQVGARTVLVSTTLYTPAADMAIPNLASLLTTIRAITSA